MVSTSQVEQVLGAWLGNELVGRMGDTVEQVLLRLNAFSPDKQSLLRLTQELDSMLFLAVREKTMARMIVRLYDGTSVRVEVGDFPVMADDLMYLLFSRFPLDARHLMLLREYSLHAESLSALRALITRYTDYETPDELRQLKQIVISCHPPFRWRSWLKQP